MQLNFSENLRILRARKKLSQKDIGDLLGLTSQAISRWENGSSEPDNASLVKLSKYFNVSTDYLLNNQELEISNNNELDQLLYSKAKELSDEDKKTVLNVISAIKKDIDNNELK